MNINAANISTEFHGNNDLSGITPFDFISGTFKWTDNQGNTYPLKDCYVELIRSEGNNQSVIQNSYTDDSGNYSFLFIADTTVSNTGILTPHFIYKLNKYFVRIYSKTEHSGVVKSLDSNNYYYDTAGISFSNFISTTMESFDLSYTFTNDGLEDNYIGRAFEISQTLYYGEKYVYEMSGEHPDFENAEYPNSSINGSSAYHNTIKGISLGEYVYCYWDVILHEYGHHIQEMLNITKNPGLEHYALGDDIEYINSNNKKYTKDEGIRLAWGESWPTVFGNLVTKYYGNELKNIQYINDDNYDAPDENNLRWGHSLENNLYKNKIIKLGEGCEANIMQVLYDLYDDNINEEFDNIALGHKGLWDLVVSSKAYTFYDFASYVYNASNVDANDFSKILAEYGMSPTDIRISSYSSINSTPTLSWSKCNNNRSEKYTIEITNKWNTKLLEINDIVGEKYTLTGKEWNTICTGYGKQFRIRIASYQIMEPVTGPYYSEYFEFPNLCNVLTFEKDTRIIEDSFYLTENIATVYSITFKRSGLKLIQTLGDTDTKIYLYNPENKLLKADDNSGYNNNAFININLEANVVYRIKIIGSNKDVSGYSRLLITEFDGFTTNLNGIDKFTDLSSVEVSDTGFVTENDQYYSKMFRFIPPIDGNYMIQLFSSFNNYLYLLDPTSTDEFVEDIDYNDDNGYGNAEIRRNLKANIPYVVIISQYNPNDYMSNNKCSVTITKL